MRASLSRVATVGSVWMWSPASCATVQRAGPATPVRSVRTLSRAPQAICVQTFRRDNLLFCFRPGQAWPVVHVSIIGLLLIKWITGYFCKHWDLEIFSENKTLPEHIYRTSCEIYFTRIYRSNEFQFLFTLF